MSTPLSLTVPDCVTTRRVAVRRGPLAVLDAAPAVAAGVRHGTAVLVPGYTGSKEDFLALLAPLAAAGHRVVTYDQRGQHASPGPDAADAYTVAALAEELLELVEVIGDGPVHVVGHSFGGLVARAAVLADPAAFRSLTLLDSGPAAIDGARAERIRVLRPVLDGAGLPAVWDRMMTIEAAEGATPAAPDVVAFLRDRFLASSAAGLRAMGEQLLVEPDRVAELRATGVPTLVAYGENDDAWSPAAQAEMANRLDARHRVIRGAAHSPNVEATQETAAVLLDFWHATEEA